MSISATEVPTAAPSAAAVREDDLVEVVIRPRRGWIAVDWKELWRYRELLYFLVWRDVKVRYKQAILGFAWAIIAPLITVGIFTMIFGRAGGFDRVGYVPPGVPYFVFIFGGFIPWMMMSQAISSGGISLITQQNLLSKIYMPRLFIPSAIIGTSMVDMAISFVVFAMSMVVAGVTPAWSVVVLPLLILLTILMSMGLAFTLSAMTVTYRDLRFLLPFIVQILMLISAVAFPSKVLEHYRILRYLNPIAGIIDACRAAIFGWYPGPWRVLYWHLTYSALFAVVLFLFGLLYFRKTERRFADIA